MMAAAALAACSDPEDRAAKKRIFSPEDPPKAVASAAEQLPPEALPRDPSLARRVLGMGAAEATERLGPHKWTATVQFEWTGPRSVKLEETRTLLVGAGGVDGDFHATLENSRNQGLDLIRARGDVYARSRFGKFRQRKRDRGVAERERDDVYGLLGEIDRIFRGRIALKAAGMTEHEGRQAWKYDAELAATVPTAGGGEKLPPPRYAKQGADPDTQRRLRFAERAEPHRIAGELLVDAKTSVVLKSRLQGTVNAPGEDGGTVTLALSVTSEVSDIGKDPAIAAPAEFVPDADKPEGIAAALDRFGIPRGDAMDAGVAASGQKRKPADEPAALEDEG
jgi:hypothetical protein